LSRRHAGQQLDMTTAQRAHARRRLAEPTTPIAVPPEPPQPDPDGPVPPLPEPPRPDDEPDRASQLLRLAELPRAAHAAALRRSRLQSDRPRTASASSIERTAMKR
jgi:hypothetical protein